MNTGTVDTREAANVHQVAFMLRLSTSTFARTVKTTTQYPRLEVPGRPEVWWTRRGRRQMRNALAHRDGGRCFYCRRGVANVHTLTFDHYLPKALGRWCGWHSWHLSNIVFACEPCNARKQDGVPWPLVWLLLANTDALLALDHQPAAVPLPVAA
ncbi:hypothetical protein ABZ912_42475 [Nonomuraea angiospora]|uniref:HNH endonuclease n=1 Tax=Nonomuraea angiospora TaxID=46172 RepID=UPI0033E11ED8